MRTGGGYLIHCHSMGFLIILDLIVLGCHDAEVPFGHPFQPAAKICISILFDNHFAHFFLMACAYVCVYQRLAMYFR